MQILSSPDQLAFNTITENKKIYPVEQMIDVNKNIIRIMAHPLSLSIIKVAYKK